MPRWMTNFLMYVVPNMLSILLMGAVSLHLLFYKGTITMQQYNSVHALLAMICEGFHAFLVIFKLVIVDGWDWTCLSCEINFIRTSKINVINEISMMWSVSFGS